MDLDYSNRHYLLPNGCKDLVDTLFLNVPKETTVTHVAQMLHQQPVKLIADLFQMGVFASPRQKLDFETVSKLAHKYGYVAQLEIPR